MRQKEILRQCEVWKKDIVEGMQQLHSKNLSISSLRDYLRNLTKYIDTLKLEMSKIKVSDFQESADDVNKDSDAG